MSIELSQPIAAYVQAANAQDTAALLATLTTDAVIKDEGHEYRGHDEIREWSQKTNREYQAVLDVTAVQQMGEETVVTALVSGTFEGSPLVLHFHFTLRDGKIAMLTVKG